MGMYFICRLDSVKLLDFVESFIAFYRLLHILANVRNDEVGESQKNKKSH